MKENQSVRGAALEGQRMAEDAQRLLQELQIHQIELEMQNEELVRSRSEVEEVLELYTELYDFAPVGYFIMDRDGVIRRINLTGARLLGLERGALLGRRFGLFVSPVHSERFNSFIDKVFAGLTKQTCEVALCGQKNGVPSPDPFGSSSSGETGRFMVSIEAIASENAPECRAVMTDITEQKRTEEERIKLLAELERSNKDLEQFANVASHELQEPLRMVSSFTQLLAKRYGDKLDQHARDYLDFAVKGSNRMQRMIKDLLDYSCVVTAEKAPVPTDMNGVINETLANLHLAISDSGALVIHDALPVVMADHSLLVQVFQNLIGNAIKFRRDEPLRIHVSASKNGDEWVFSVKDNGMGIEPQYFERIFVLFERLHSGETYQGTGIGLALCKRIIDRLEGRIWVESKPGEGSAFHFTLKGVP